MRCAAISGVSPRRIVPPGKFHAIRYDERTIKQLAEEIGLVGYRLLPAGTAGGIWDGHIDRVHFFELRLEQLPELQLDSREIIGARLVPAAELRRYT